MKDFFHLNMDRIKWLISDYSNKNEGDRVMLQKMICSMAKIALDQGMSLIVESQKQLVSIILELYEEQDIDIKYISIEAPLDILKERFKKRVEGAKREGRKLGNTSEDRLIEMYYEYKETKFKDGITLDTNKLSKEEVVVEIEKYIGASV